MKFSFPQTFAGSVSNREFYRDDLQKRRARNGVGYLFALLVLLGVVSAIKWVAAASMLNIGTPVIETQKQIVRDIYPAELVVTVQSGSVSTNVREPYAIPVPPQWKRWMEAAGRDKTGSGMMMADDGAPFDNIVVIDTSASPEDYPGSRAIVLVTKNSIVHPSRNSESLKGNYEVTPIDPATAMTIDRQGYDEFMRETLPYVDKFIVLAKNLFIAWVVVSPFVLGALGLAGHALWLLLGVLLLWIIDIAFLKKNFRYGELYKLSVYGLTVPILVAYAANLLGLTFPLLFTLAYLAWMTYVLQVFPARPKPV